MRLVYVQRAQGELGVHDRVAEIRAPGSRGKNAVDRSEGPASESEVARWARIENGVRQDAARLARLVLEGQASSFEAQLLARRIDSVRTSGIGAEY